MITFNASALNTLTLASEIAADVEAQLAALQDKKRFNVKQYSEQLAATGGHDELFVATLVRTIVDGCDEYTSQRGRNGGVGKSTAEDLAKKAAKRAGVSVAAVTTAVAVTEVSAAEAETSEPAELETEVTEQEQSEESTDQTSEPELSETTLSDENAPANNDEDDLDFLDALASNE